MTAPAPDFSAATVARVVEGAARVVAAAGGAGVLDREAAVVALRHAAEAAGAVHIVQALRHTAAIREVDQVLTAAQALREAHLEADPPARPGRDEQAQAAMAEVAAATGAHMAAFDLVFPDGAQTTPEGVNLAAVPGTITTCARLTAAVEAFHAALALPTA